MKTIKILYPERTPTTHVLPIQVKSPRTEIIPRLMTIRTMQRPCLAPFPTRLYLARLGGH